jgi:hypothetical protein
VVGRGPRDQSSGQKRRVHAAEALAHRVTLRSSLNSNVPEARSFDGETFHVY